MGKRLIIKGADFSENGIAGAVDITSLFSTWESGTFDNNGNDKGSSTYKRSSAVDISDYAGKKMTFTNTAYKTGAGERPVFYSIFLDENDDLCGRIQVEFAEDAAASTGYTVVQTIDIPADAVSFRATYFDETKELSFNFDDFNCVAGV